jgi:type II secretory ATPase GspE/PulE/Tfp pilus assembly ATPase PilB-like protein
VRVEFNRTFDGFSFVSRLLDQQKTPTLDELGFTKAMMHSLIPILTSPSGLVLVSGPTGSGKSTLLNAMLQYLNDGTRAISTIEDPVEYRLGDGSIKQIQVGGDITFARGLRSVLRQDPDIIFLGEIRDTETMETAIQAAQTGHLVFSTIHANSAHETVSRAVDLCVDKEIDGGRIAGVLKFVIAQRLVNRYEGAWVPRNLTNNEINWMHINGIPIPRNFSEVVPEVKKGKMAVVEAIVINDDLKVLLRSGKAKNEDIYRLARLQAQYESLASCGMRGVESNGCLLKDCMEGLDNNSDARLHPGSRLLAAKEHDLQLSVVSMLIDKRIEEAELMKNTTKRLADGSNEDLFACLERRSKRREVMQPEFNEEQI